MSIKHAPFWDVVDGYERKDEQDKQRLAALENLFATVCHGRTPMEAAIHWRRMTKVASVTRLSRTRSQFNVIANAIEGHTLRTRASISHWQRPIHRRERHGRETDILTANR